MNARRIPTADDLHDLASGIFDCREDARRWFELQNAELSGAKPNDVISTEIGRVEIRRILRRLKYGVYS